MGEVFKIAKWRRCYSECICAKQSQRDNRLCKTLPAHCQWIAIGDWNMVEVARNKSTEEGRLIGGQEIFEFDLFKSHLHIMDFFKYKHNLKYLWNNRGKKIGK